MIEQARLIAKTQHTSLNALFRQWLADYTAHHGPTENYDSLMTKLSNVQAGRKFTRDEMNER